MDIKKMQAAAIALRDNNCEENYIEHINQSCSVNVLELIAQREALMLQVEEFRRKYQREQIDTNRWKNRAELAEAERAALRNELESAGTYAVAAYKEQQNITAQDARFPELDKKHLVNLCIEYKAKLEAAEQESLADETLYDGVSAGRVRGGVELTLFIDSDEECIPRNIRLGEHGIESLLRSLKFYGYALEQTSPQAAIPEWNVVTNEDWNIPRIGQRVILCINGVVQNDSFTLDQADGEPGCGYYFWDRDDINIAECPEVKAGDMWIPWPDNSLSAGPKPQKRMAFGAPSEDFIPPELLLKPDLTDEDVEAWRKSQADDGSN